MHAAEERSAPSVEQARQTVCCARTRQAPDFLTGVVELFVALQDGRCRRKRIVRGNTDGVGRRGERQAERPSSSNDAGAEGIARQVMDERPKREGERAEEGREKDDGHESPAGRGAGEVQRDGRPDERGQHARRREWLSVAKGRQVTCCPPLISLPLFDWRQVTILVCVPAEITVFRLPLPAAAGEPADAGIGFDCAPLKVHVRCA